MARVLVVDDEPSIRETLSEFLIEAGHEVSGAESVADAVALLSREEFDVVVSDVILPQASGLELLAQLAESSPRVKVIVITGEPNFATAAEALRHGAFEYLPKPVRRATIVHAVNAAARVKALEDENRRHQERLEVLVAERTRQLRDYSERLRAIAHRTRDFASCAEVGELAPCVLSTLAESLGASGGSFFRKQHDHLELLVALDPEHQPRRLDLPLPGGSILARVLEHQEGLVVDEIARRSDLQSSGWTGYQNGSLLALPCVDGDGQTVGVVTLHDKRLPPFTEEDLDLGRIIAAHTVEAIRVIELNARLRASERRYRGMLEQSLMGVALVQDGRLRYANRRLAGILGCPGEDVSPLIGRPVLDLVHEDSRALAAAGLERRLRGDKGERLECLRAQRFDGALAWVDAVASRVEHEGRPALLVTVVDATARRHAEIERERLLEQFLQAQKMEAIGRLAGGVAHDFNNILMVITINTDLLLSRLGDEHPCAPDLREVQHAAERAAALTRQLLAFSRHQVREPRVLDLNAAVNASRRMLARLIGEDIALTFNPGLALPRVDADPTQVDQVLLNLVSNARDAMPRGGAVTIDTRQRAADVEGGTGWVVLSVRDTGCGMSEADCARAFEPFFTTKERGTGLGLATVRSIAAQSGGRVELESCPGRGTEVRVVFPACPGAAVAQAGGGATSSPPCGSETILLAEDDTAVRRLTTAMLESLGYTVVEARSGEEALRLAAQQQEPYDLFLGDVVLPGRSGPETLAGLRARWPGLRQLFVSGYADDVVGQHGVLGPGVRLLRKPFSMPVLAAAVRDALDGI